MIILENYNINRDVNTIGDKYFAMSIVFRNEPHKRHILSGQSEFQIQEWINAIKQASYGYWRSQLIQLQQILCKKTGKDPLLMYPRNKGVIRDDAWEAKPTFRSHIKSFTTISTTKVDTVPKEVNLINFI